MGQAVLVNVLLLGLFGLQHSTMARPWFKKRWTKIVPTPIERSTYVLLTSLILGLLYWQWRPMTSVVWHVDHDVGRFLLKGLSFSGFALVLYSTILIDHFDLFGIRQVLLHLQRKEYTHPQFVTPWLYCVIRNPLMLGFIIAFWATPDMTTGHVLFAAVTTAYILVGIQLEERDLSNILGEDYRRFRAQTPMLLPWPRKRAPTSDRPEPSR